MSSVLITGSSGKDGQFLAKESVGLGWAFEVDVATLVKAIVHHDRTVETAKMR